MSIHSGVIYININTSTIKCLVLSISIQLSLTVGKILAIFIISVISVSELGCDGFSFFFHCLEFCIQLHGGF